MIQLGYTVRDMVTGFEGLAVGRCEYLYGCTRIGIQPTKMKDGKPLEEAWFDEQRVEIVKKTAKPMSKASAATTGGPMRNPPRASDPR